MIGEGLLSEREYRGGSNIWRDSMGIGGFFARRNRRVLGHGENLVSMTRQETDRSGSSDIV